MADKLRICVINTHPIQYFAPLYAELAKEPDIDLEVFYLSDFSLRGGVDPGFGRTVRWDIDLLSGYKHRFVGKSYRQLKPGRSFLSIVVPELFTCVIKGHFDAVVIHGYGYAANILALLAGKLSGARVLFRADANALLLQHNPPSLMKRLYVKTVLSLCDQMLAIGTRNREFYSWFGVPEGKLTFVPFIVDNSRFFSASRLAPGEVEAVREGWGLSRAPTFIFVSKLTRGKRPDLVVEALGELAEEGVVCQLVVAGSGEMEAELRQLGTRYAKLPIAFLGFVNQSELPRLFGAVDALVFPSVREQWGLIVNEAMAAGLPVVVGEEVGCVPDLVMNDENGFRVRSNDKASLKHALRRLATEPETRQRMSEASLRIMGKWGFTEYRAGMRRALKLPAGAGPIVSPLSSEQSTHLH